MSSDHLVKVAEAAKAIGLSKFTLYRAAKAGEVPCYKQGRALRFSIEEVKEAMRQPSGQLVSE